MNTKSKKGLGKGLDALLGGNRGVLEKTPRAEDRDRQPTHSSKEVNQPLQRQEADLVVDEQVRDLSIEDLQPGKYQPRRVMDSDSLEELAVSIKNQGVMQPIIVRPLSAEQKAANQGSGLVRYEIIAGERRWRAVQLAGLTKIPAIVRDVSDEAAIAMALIENLQRDNLNPMDEAQALFRLQQEFELTHQEVADAVGKSRASVSNSLRLMNLTEDVKRLLENGDIEMGHARALLALEQGPQRGAALEVVEKRLSVRQTEALVKALQNKGSRTVQQKAVEPDVNTRTLENELSEKLGASVKIQHNPRGKGKLVVSYNSLDELDGILNHIK